MRPIRQPFALDIPRFDFAALANFAARAPIGGTREVAIAAFVTARMARDLVVDPDAPVVQRRARAVGARRWLSGLAISDQVRRALGELITATETDAKTTGIAVRRVMEVTEAVFDPASRSELERLAKELDAQAVGGQ